MSEILEMVPFSGPIISAKLMTFLPQTLCSPIQESQSPSKGKSAVVGLVTVLLIRVRLPIAKSTRVKNASILEGSLSEILVMDPFFNKSMFVRAMESHQWPILYRPKSRLPLRGKYVVVVNRLCQSVAD